MHGSVIYSTARGLLFTKLPPEEQNAICMVKCSSVIALHFQSLRTLPQTETDTISSPGMQREPTVTAHAHAFVVHGVRILNRGGKKPSSHCQNYLFQQVPVALRAGLRAVAWCTNHQPNFRSTLSTRHHKAYLFQKKEKTVRGTNPCTGSTDVTLQPIYKYTQRDICNLKQGKVWVVQKDIKYV